MLSVSKLIHVSRNLHVDRASRIYLQLLLFVSCTTPFVFLIIKNETNKDESMKQHLHWLEYCVCLCKVAQKWGAKYCNVCASAPNSVFYNLFRLFAISNACSD